MSIVIEPECPQPCADLSQQDISEGKTCALHPCICEVR